MSVLPTLLVLGLLDGSTSDSTPKPAIRLRLESTRPVFPSPDDVELRITVENVGATCYPVYTDTSFLPSPVSQRPSTVLTLELRNDKGQRLEPQPSMGGDVRGVRPEDLLILNCGSLYGRYIPLSKGDWQYTLGPGRYSARARAVSRVGTFVRSKPQLFETLQRLVRLSRETVGYMLQDWSADSEDVRFEVRRE
jgi:hypothetical protein